VDAAATISVYGEGKRAFIASRKGPVFCFPTRSSSVPSPALAKVLRAPLERLDLMSLRTSPQHMERLIRVHFEAEFVRIFGGVQKPASPEGRMFGEPRQPQRCTRSLGSRDAAREGKR
jgi:hypothetical protein